RYSCTRAPRSLSGLRVRSEGARRIVRSIKANSGPVLNEIERKSRPVSSIPQ
ncbi:MAG: hypothetical protein, partial [Olavius algarvensis Gamma 1 endosymbiont]